MKSTEWIWRDGEFVPWAQATTHVLTHALHYGSAVFEGIRAYATARGTCCFRLTDHLRRLHDSARIYEMPLRWDVPALADACKELLRRNHMSHAYVRPLVFRGYGELGIDPTTCPVETIVAALDWGRYFKGAEEGVDVCVSSWRRVAPDTLPAMAKAVGNYLSSQLIRLEAKRHGYAEGIALDVDGALSEGSGQNLFLVHRGVLWTPDQGTSILHGITRDTVLTLAQELGIETRPGRLPREMLYSADEVFLVGTAAEITPVRSVDRIAIGAGAPGPLTKAIQAAFAAVLSGEGEDQYGWLEPVQ